ncbi:TFIIB-type zinc ribbon-containing protein [Aerosakkonema funiforme]|uniref:Zf-TFIIB domain-containing protein n=1 Tax=Aerosakkonema funiforme FACHB-1375 TaxID=2949571 RepID=A0A926VN86_9CYAN|nr:zf-TFIIB domain-containing protein [Aerosakkonema funiforme]MBD2186318.1 zf-TFIIB domain-containing protein [Aerosakkonema funiforme FACHB-1375]
MKCPACENNLTEIVTEAITVDVCEGGCGGIWFDRFELHHVDEPTETIDEILLNIHKNEQIQVDDAKKRHCPRCQNIVMMRHYFSVKKEVLVDECPKCGGYWLDAGELPKIRNEFSSEAAREAAADEYFSQVFKQYGIAKETK